MVSQGTNATGQHGNAYHEVVVLDDGALVHRVSGMR